MKKTHVHRGREARFKMTRYAAGGFPSSTDTRNTLQVLKLTLKKKTLKFNEYFQNKYC